MPRQGKKKKTPRSNTTVKGATKNYQTQTKQKHDWTQDPRTEDELLDALVEQNREEYEEMERKQKQEEKRREIINTPKQTLDTKESVELPWIPSLYTSVSTMLPESRLLLQIFQELEHRHQQYVMLTHYKQGLRLLIDTNGAYLYTRQHTQCAFIPSSLYIDWVFSPVKGYIDVTSSSMQLAAFLYALMPSKKHLSMYDRAQILFLFTLRWIRQWMLPQCTTGGSQKSSEEEVGAKDVHVHHVYYLLSELDETENDNKQHITKDVLEEPTPSLIDSATSLRRDFRLRI